jgi:predicted permease
MVTASVDSRRQRNPVSPQNFLDWRDRTSSFQAMAAMSPPMPVGLSGFGQPIAVDGMAVSPDFFRILGVRPLLGRVFDAREEVPGGPPLVVLSYSLWRRQFGGDRTAVGHMVRILDMPHTIVGVMPEGFDLPFEHAELWTPFAISRAAAADQGRYLDVLAKLKPGVSMARAQADLEGVARQIAVERPETNRGWSAGVLSLSEQTTGDVDTALWLLFGAVTFVLLIAAGNVASLLMMRGTARRREIALRVALGAGRGRIVSQLLTESLLLSLAGGVLGVGLAVLGLRMITASLPALALPRVEGVAVNARVLGFSLALALLTTLLFGLTPALAFARTSAQAALRAGDRGATHRGGLGRILVVVEVALSLVLLAGAGLLARSFLNQVGVSRGFRTDHVLTMQMFFAPARYYDDHRRAAYLDRILSRVRTIPGVDAASSANLLAMTGVVSGSGFWRLDRPEPLPGAQPTADFVIVSPQYFHVMGIPLLGGRDLDGHDTMSTEPAIVVNQEFAERFFPGENPIGKRLHLSWNVQHGVIVGVCARARQTSLAVPPQPTLFLAQAQGPMYFGSLVVRTRGAAPAALASAVEEAVHAVDPDQAVSAVASMEEVVAHSVARPRLEAVLLGIFAALAATLAVGGLYGVLAYSVAQRTREIGIRMALGADAGRLLTGVVRDGLGLMLAGIVAGLAAALALTRLLASLLYEVKPADPLTFAGVCALLLAVGLGAAWVPARRVVRVDPARSLRWE